MAQPTERPRKTVEDYMALPDDVRAELIDGELYVTPSPASSHQDATMRLCALLMSFTDDRDLGRVGLSPLDVHLPSGDVVQPDVFFVSREREAIFRTWVYGAPDLAVEVVSPGRPERDRYVKRNLYERNRIPEYWLVDVEERTVEVLSLRGKAYAPAGYFERDQVLRSPLLDDLRLPLADVFRDSCTG